MMKRNVGAVDRVIRVIIGLVLGYIGIRVGGGLAVVLIIIGLVSLLTGLAGWCPIYRALKLSTCPLER